MLKRLKSAWSTLLKGLKRSALSPILKPEQKGRKKKSKPKPKQTDALLPVPRLRKTDLAVPEIFRAEIISLQYPFFFLADLDKIEIGNPKSDFYWLVAPNPEFGKPAKLAWKVHRAVEKIITDYPRPISNPVPLGSLYRLGELIGWDPQKVDYGKLKRAFKSIKSATIEIKDKSAKLEGVTGLYHAVYFRGEKMPNGEVADQVYLFLSEWYLDHLNRFLVRPLDANLYNNLTLDEARLYELVGTRFYGLFQFIEGGLKQVGNYTQLKYSELCQLFPLMRKRYLSWERRLPKAHQGLIDKGYFEKVETEEIEPDEFGKDWLFKYYPGEVAKEEIKRHKKEQRQLLREETPQLGPEEKADIDLKKKLLEGWVVEMKEALEDSLGKNEKFYRRLGQLIVQGKISEELVRQCLAETRVEAEERLRDKDKEPIHSRSAYFTDLLKRRLKERDLDLKALLKE